MVPLLVELMAVQMELRLAVQRVHLMVESSVASRESSTVDSKAVLLAASWADLMALMWAELKAD